MIKKFEIGPVAKHYLKYLLHIGGSGMGKTRSLLELRNMLLKIDQKKSRFSKYLTNLCGFL